MEVTQKAFSLILNAVKDRRLPSEVVGLVLEQSCLLANVVHGSFILIDHQNQSLIITSTYGPDWTPEKKECRLRIGQGVTGTVAATGYPYLCDNVASDASYVPLFQYVKSELAVPVIVREKVWGVINLDGMKVGCFSQDTVRLIVIFAEMVAFAFTLQEEFREQQRMQEELMQSQKLASLGKIIAGIAHEINNPLTTILGHASLLELNPEVPASPASIHAIISESQRVADIVRTLLEFARKEVGAKQLLNVHDLIQQVSEIKKYQLHVNNIVIQIEGGGEYLPIEASSQQIRQVLLNLINNAEQAIPPNRPGLIKVWVEHFQDSVMIKVRDNGKGIPEEVRSLIFDPFFTTKKVGQGTGLGLSMARSIMQSHGGRLYLESTTGEGTCFVMEFPLAQVGLEVSTNGSVVADNHKLVPSAEQVSSKRILGTVLVVDDEEGILQFISRFLGAMRVKVVTATDGLSGLQKIETGTFDLVISDIKMPGLTGLEMYERAKAIHPRYKNAFIFMSGDFMSQSTRDFVEVTGCRFLEKPFAGKTLWELVSKLLPQRSPRGEAPSVESTKSFAHH
jgi:two-component system NtrC family sensor kinase